MKSYQVTEAVCADLRSLVEIHYDNLMSSVLSAEDSTETNTEKLMVLIDAERKHLTATFEANRARLLGVLGKN